MVGFGPDWFGLELFPRASLRCAGFFIILKKIKEKIFCSLV